MAAEMDKSYDEINSRINELEHNGYLSEKTSNNKLYTQLNNLMKEIMPYTKGNSSEDRDKPYYEDRLVSIIKRVPPEMYQYIGPYMHTVPYMSERILNLPGIKETKGKFPTRIAPQMQDYVKKYGKYMSPQLYILLMPEAWPQNQPKSIEKTAETKIIDTEADPTKYKLDLSAIEALAPASKYYPTETKNNKDIKDLPRDNKATRTSPLAEGDVIAFIHSIDDVRDFEKANPNRRKAIRRLGYRINKIGSYSGDFDPKGMMLDIAYPCERLAQRILYLKLDDEFTKTVATKHGFSNIDGWAFTCDKTIKAYRAATMDLSTSFSISEWKRQRKKGQVKYPNLTENEQKIVYQAVDLFLEMFTSNYTDILAVKPYLEEIREPFFGYDRDNLISLPVYAVK